jgi:VCBS repeat-containing protein
MPMYEYAFSFDAGLSPWASWMSPSLIFDEDEDYPHFVRLQAPGTADPNHIDGIGALWLVSHLSATVVGSPGILDLRDAEIDITIKSEGFDPNGARLVFWIASYLPGQDVVLNFPVALQVTNWAYSAQDLAGDVTGEWQTLTVRLSADEADWTYAGNFASGQGDWADRYAFLDLQTALSHVDATLHLVLVSDDPDHKPSGFLDIAAITIRTATPAEAPPPSPTPPPPTSLVAYGVEDQDLAGTLPIPEGAAAGLTYTVVDGSVRNGTLALDPSGSFLFTPDADHYGPTDFVDPATFQYIVTDEHGSSGPFIVHINVAPINDAPLTAMLDENWTIAGDEAFATSLFKGSDVDGDSLTFNIVEGSVTHGSVVLDARNGRYVFTPEEGFSGVAGFRYVVSDGQEQSAAKEVLFAVAPLGDPPAPPSYAQIADLLPDDIEGFARWAIVLADAGNTNAAYHYGTWLLSGRFVAADTVLAAHYLGLAKDTVPDAAFQLVDMYLAGDGVDRDHAMARSLLSELLPSARAHYQLGILDDLGIGAPENDAAAVNHFVTAAKLGHLDSMYTLGRRYLSGAGVEASADDAYFWLGVALRFGAGPNLIQVQQLLNHNLSQAAAGLTPERIAALDAAIATWAPGAGTPVNDAPALSPDLEGASGQAGPPVTGALLRGTDADGDTLTFHLVPGSETHGLVAIDPATGAFSFQPDAGFVGEASFQYLLSDGQDESAAKTVILTILPATAAFADSVSIDESLSVEGTALSGVLANDLSGDGGPLQVTAVDSDADKVGVPLAGAYGTLVLNQDGSFSYTADRAFLLTEGQSATDRFTYRIADEHGATSSATLTFTITGIDGIVVAAGGTIFGTAFDDSLTGGDQADYLIGLDGNDRLDGGSGAGNQLQGGRGDDIYVVGVAGDTIIEFADEGIDTVRTALLSYTLRTNVETLVFTGIGDFTGTGNLADNEIVGGAGNDLLDGGDGADRLIGGRGDDIYIVTDAGDTLVELAGEGSDTVRTTLSGYSLAGHVEKLVFTGTGDFAGTGNDGDNEIVGGAGNDLLDGGAGADRLIGGAGADRLVGGLGDDLYEIDDLADQAVEAAGEGIDTIETTLTSFTLSDNVENLTFVGTGDFTGTGTGADNEIEGGAGDDLLDGRGGGNLLVGGAGRDTITYASALSGIYVNLTNNFAARNGFGASDRLSGIEDVTGSDHDDILIGNSGANRLQGGLGSDYLVGLDGDDELDGGAGAADQMQGGRGNDLYIVRAAGDTVIEAAGEGIDTIETALSSYALRANVENLVFTGTGDFTGTGTDADNEISGGAGDDLLDGRGGSDLLVGGAGRDTITYAGALAGVYVNLTSNLAAANGYGGSDRLSGIEDVIGGDHDDILIGDAGANRLQGGLGADYLVGLDGDDELDGGAGAADQMQGGRGDDVYIVRTTGDTIIEAAGEGLDTVLTALSKHSLAANVERLVFTGTGGFFGIGNDGDNEIVGAAGKDLLDGGAGADRLIGGLGNDVYAVDNVGDQVVEESDQGVDTVETMLSSYSLGANVENLVFMGVGNFTGTGNLAGNAIVGGAGDDRLIGGAGAANELAGRGGNDTYVVAVAGDTITENAGGGIDTVETALASYRLLAAEVENLTGTSASGQSLTGNGGANFITGGSGNDVLNGGLGADILIGNAGADSYLFDSAPGGGNIDTITGFASGSDRILLDNGAFTTLIEGGLAPGAFVTGTAALDANDRIIYDSATGKLYYDADGNGAGAAVQFATLSGHPIVTAGDFGVI